MQYLYEVFNARNKVIIGFLGFYFLCIIIFMYSFVYLALYELPVIARLFLYIFLSNLILIFFTKYQFVYYWVKYSCILMILISSIINIYIIGISLEFFYMRDIGLVMNGFFIFYMLVVFRRINQLPKSMPIGWVFLKFIIIPIVVLYASFYLFMFIMSMYPSGKL